MADWALVVGIDKYAEPRLCLKGAVRDALAMAAWLTGAGRGGVAARRLHLLLSRADWSPEPPPGLEHREATLEKIVWAVRDLAGKAAGPDDRLYVHISCHGLSATGLLGGDAILPSDFKTAAPTLSLQVQGLLDYLKTSRFRLQFFFIDACRNVPFEGRFNAGPFPIAPDVTEMRPEVEQFVFAATSRGLKSNEDRSRANDERGVFTEALLRGLRGEGAAKRYNLLKRRYEVRPEDLLRFVAGEVRRKVAALDVGAGAGSFQVPTLRGERSSSPVLAAFAEEEVPPLNLSVDLQPPGAATVTTVRALGAGVSGEAGPPLNVPHVMALKPRDYLVEAEAPGFEAEPVAVRLMRDAEVGLKMTPAVPSAPAASETVQAAAGRMDVPDADAPVVEAAAAPPARASLRAFTWDPLVPIEIRDASGRRVAVGAGQIELKTAEPGSYTIRLHDPRGVAEKPVFLKPGAAAEVEILPPAIRYRPTLTAACAIGEIDATGVNTLRVSERLGAPQVGLPEVTTLLAMALALTPGSETAETAWRLGRLREALPVLGSPPEGWGAVQVVVVDEAAGAEDSLLAAGLSLSEMDGGAVPAGLALLPAALPNVAAASAPLEAGAYLLEGQTDGERMRISLPVLPGRITNVILHRDTNGGVAGYAFLPPLDASGGDVLLQRRLELAQRFLHGGETEAALEILTPRGKIQSETPGNREELSILTRGEDPVASVLGAYTGLQLMEASRGGLPGARELAERSSFSLQRRFGDLSDGLVIGAALARLAGDDSSAAALCREALERGLPLFYRGVVHLGRLAASLGLEHPRVPVLKEAARRRAGGTILAIWSPGAEPGAPLIEKGAIEP